MTTTQQPFTAEAAIKEVSAVPLVGEQLLTRINQLEQSGVASKDVLIRCGYYVEGGDYGKANIDFFDAKLKAQKANGSWKPWTPPSAEDLEQEEEEAFTKDDAIECLKEELADNQLGNEDLMSKARAYLLLEGEISEKVKSVINDFCKSIKPEDRYEDFVSIEECAEIATPYVMQYDNERFSLESQYFDFLDLYWSIDRIEGQPDYINDWNTALVMMDFVERNPQHPHLRNRFADFMTNSTEAGMEYSAYMSFRSPVFDCIKDELNKLRCFDVGCILTGAGTDGTVIESVEYEDHVAKVLDDPQTIENLKQLGYIVKPRTSAEIAKEKAAREAESLKRIAEKEDYEKEYYSVPKEQRDREEAFFTALSDCDFDELINKAEEYKSLLLTNISEFAENFTSECPYEATGEEPQWLLQALLKAGAKLSGVSTQSAVAVEGKKVCVTGKLQLKRAEVERQLVIKGAKVVGSVSKNTDLLVVGADAGSKLDKAKTLGVTVLTEEEAIEQGVISLESVYDYYRFTIAESVTTDRLTHLFKDDIELYEMIGEQEIVSREGVVVDPDNCVVGNFFYTDWADDLQLVRFANGEDFDLYMETMDGETGHFVYQYFEVIEGGEVKARVEGISPDCDEYHPDKAKRFAECKEMGLFNY